jgi:hypothetical protein
MKPETLRIAMRPVHQSHMQTTDSCRPDDGGLLSTELIRTNLPSYVSQNAQTDCAPVSNDRSVSVIVHVLVAVKFASQQSYGVAKCPFQCSILVFDGTTSSPALTPALARCTVPAR